MFKTNNKGLQQNPCPTPIVFKANLLTWFSLGSQSMAGNRI